MASDARVRRALRAMAAATNTRFYSDEQEAPAIIAFAAGLGAFGDDAVDLAASEWCGTMAKFPTLVEFATLVRKHEEELYDQRALTTGGMAPRRRPALGKPGAEGIATQIVLNRIVREVGKITASGYYGRLAGMSDSTHPGPGLRAMGHVFDAFGRHEPAGFGAGHCVRCQQIATVAFEQVVDFDGSSATWEGWDGPLIEAVRGCANASCDHGWVTKLTIDDGRLVERLVKCESCGGPQPKVPRKDTEKAKP